MFGPALDQMAAEGSRLYGPESFKDYLEKYDLESSSRTPAYISVDTLAQLSPELREAGVMVLRLGSAPEGTGTQFVLVEPRETIQEFFLRDGDVFEPGEEVQFESPIGPEKLLGFRLLPKLSETSLVNLALASGVLSEGLALDSDGALMPPATGRSTFTFQFKPHSSLDKRLTHRMGQVEIDTLFAERRNGDMALFVIEAKTESDRSTLAKHKLMYPVLALADEVPGEFDIIPVFLRCGQQSESMTFRIAECKCPDPRTQTLGIDRLEAKQSSTIRLSF